jgi:hypothetical protein
MTLLYGYPHPEQIQQFRQLFSATTKYKNRCLQILTRLRHQGLGANALFSTKSQGEYAKWLN